MKNLIQAAVVTLFAASTAQAQQAVQWKVSDGGNGHWYGVREHAGPIDSSALNAQIQSSLGGHLATIPTSAEDDFVWSSLGHPQFAVLGAFQDQSSPTYSEPGGGWHWVTGEPIEQFRWTFNEPSNGGGWESVMAYNYDHTWNDWQTNNIPADAAFRYIIEWDADCNSDGIVDYGQCLDGTLPDYNGNSIPDCCERGETCVIGNYPVQWRVNEAGSGHWYQVVVSPSNVNWFDARDRSRSNGGELASITSSSENEWVHQLAAKTPGAWGPNGHPFWTFGPWIGGMNSSQIGGQWQWVAGDAWSFTAWYSGQPDGGAAQVACFGCSGLPKPTWSDEEANAPVRSFAIEWSADCNRDGIVDYGQILQGQLGDTNTDGIPDICQQPTCVDADLFRDFNVNGADLGILLSQWGLTNPLTVSDINKDGAVNGADLGILLSFWGACP
jgi:hypothetical protein